MFTLLQFYAFVSVCLFPAPSGFLLCFLVTASVRECAFLCIYQTVHVGLCPPKLLRHSSTAVRWEPDLLQVMEAVERTGVKELSQEAAQALRLLLTQVDTHMHTHTPQ